MNDCSLKIDYILKENSVVVLYFYDNIYYEYIPQIKNLILEFKELGINKIIINLSECFFIEKDIWKYLVEIKSDFSKSNGDIILSDISGAVKNDYNLMELYNSLQAFQDINAALYNFGIITSNKYA